MQVPESAEAAGQKGGSADEAMQRLAAGLPCGLGAPSLGVAQTLLEQVKNFKPNNFTTVSCSTG